MELDLRSEVQQGSSLFSLLRSEAHQGLWFFSYGEAQGLWFFSYGA